MRFLGSTSTEIRDTLFLHEGIKSFSNNVPLINKPGSWFLLAKCLKNTFGRMTF